MCSAGRYCWHQITGFYLGLDILSLLFGFPYAVFNVLTGSRARVLEIEQTNDGCFAVTKSWRNLVYCFFCTAELEQGRNKVFKQKLRYSGYWSRTKLRCICSRAAPLPPRPVPHSAPRLGDCQITWQPSQTSSLNKIITNRTTKKK